ncbi:uncharacterized protein [Henckelia pumila]|uniref:uncharacterized protein isoform X2 n=1 Tax=Henckelia pumila TaxID=405737 RepID=UPI003C6E4F4F
MDLGFSFDYSNSIPASMGAAYDTTKSGVGVASMGVMRLNTPSFVSLEASDAAADSPPPSFRKDDECRYARVSELFVYDKFSRVPAETIEVGDSCAVCGIDDIQIGETIANKTFGKPLPSIKVEEPTMAFSINNSPFVDPEIRELIGGLKDYVSLAKVELLSFWISGVFFSLLLCITSTLQHRNEVSTALYLATTQSPKSKL